MAKKRHLSQYDSAGNRREIYINDDEVMTGGKTLGEKLAEMEQSIEGAGGYEKPATGIPKSDLASDVQTSLGKADTAVQDAQYVHTDNNYTSEDKSKVDNLKRVATTGSYEDLTDKPVIPEGTDLSGYYTKTEVDTLAAGKVDKETGKGLSSNDYTSAEKSKLGALPTKAELDESLAEAGKVKTVSINGTVKTPDSTGNVDLGTVEKGEKGEKGDQGDTLILDPETFDPVTGIINDLTTGGGDKALSAEMGKRLKGQIDYVYERLQAVYGQLGNIAFWNGKPSANTILPDLDWSGPKHTVTLALSLTNAVVKRNGEVVSNGSTIQVEEGGTLTLTVEPLSGYALTTVTSSTTGATVTDNEDDTYSVAIVMGQSSISLAITAEAEEVPPYEIPAGGEMVFWLDGLDLENNASEWVDKISGKIYTNSGGSVVQSGGKNIGLYFNGTNARMYNATPLDFSPQTHTIEIVCKPNGVNANYYNYLFVDGVITANGGGLTNSIHAILCRKSNGDSYMNGVFVNGTGTANQDGSWTGGHVWHLDFVNNANTIISANKTCAVKDGEALSSKGVNHWTTLRGGSNLGGVEYPDVAGSYFYSKTTIYAVRIYRGQLTAAQMLANQKVDNERYGLGLTLPNSVS